MDGPNPLAAAWSMFRARRHRRPRPDGFTAVDHRPFAAILRAVAAEGISGITDVADDLAVYIAFLLRVDPDTLTPAEAKAFWINLYNALALDLANRARSGGNDTVLGVPGAFNAVRIRVAGESLSLDDIEHGKIRRLRDPRIHGALVCGSVSCPTLRFEPFDGDVESQLDDQMRAFLASGGAFADTAADTLHLSRVFRWYGADFVWPHRMPTFLPAPRSAVARAMSRWLPAGTREWVREELPAVTFLPYDWSLGCSVGSPD